MEYRLNALEQFTDQRITEDLKLEGTYENHWVQLPVPLKWSNMTRIIVQMLFEL